MKKQDRKALASILKRLSYRNLSNDAMQCSSSTAKSYVIIAYYKALYNNNMEILDIMEERGMI